MTVICAAKFNQNSGAIIADRQISTPSTKYLLSTKLHLFQCNKDSKFIFGGTGDTGPIYEITTKISETIANEKEKIVTKYDFRDFVENIIKEYKEDYLNRRFKLELVAPPGEYPCQKEWEEQLVGKQKNILKDFNELDEYFLTLSYDQTGIGLQLISLKPEKTRLISPSYETIGSGEGLADVIMHDFFKNMDETEKQEVNPVIGVMVLLQATAAAAERNKGVGGIPQLYVIDKGKIISPRRRQLKLAEEISCAEKKGYLNDGFACEALEDLIFKNANYESVEEKMLQKAKNPTALLRFLRGY